MKALVALAPASRPRIATAIFPAADCRRSGSIAAAAGRAPPPARPAREARRRRGEMAQPRAGIALKRRIHFSEPLTIRSSFMRAEMVRLARTQRGSQSSSRFHHHLPADEAERVRCRSLEGPGMAPSGQYSRPSTSGSTRPKARLRSACTTSPTPMRSAEVWRSHWRRSNLRRARRTVIHGPRPRCLHLDFGRRDGTLLAPS